MHRTKFRVIGLAACLALAIACSRQSSAPTTPTGAAASAADPVAEDESKLVDFDSFRRKKEGGRT